MNCPICHKDVKSREFYDHMSEYHGWDMARAEHYADAEASRVNQEKRLES